MPAVNQAILRLASMVQVPRGAWSHGHGAMSALGPVLRFGPQPRISGWLRANDIIVGSPKQAIIIARWRTAPLPIFVISHFPGGRRLGNGPALAT